jgi:hypothetical protein
MYADKLLDAPSILPLMGMLLGNSLNGLSQGLNFFTKKIHESKDDVLSLIALGATTSEATKLLLQQSLRYGLAPNINDALYIAHNAVITGDVKIGKNSSIWYGCVLRGDVTKISIGDNTNR